MTHKSEGKTVKKKKKSKGNGERYELALNTSFRTSNLSGSAMLYLYDSMAILHSAIKKKMHITVL